MLRLNKFPRFRALATAALSLAAHPDLSALDLQDLLADSEPVGNRWYHCDWLGYYRLDAESDAEEGNIYHNEHGVWNILDAPYDYYLVQDSGMDREVVDAFLKIYPKNEIFGSGYPNDILRYSNSNGTPDILQYQIGTSPTREFKNYGPLDAPTAPVTEYHPITLAYLPDGPNGAIPIWWKRYSIHSGHSMVDLTQESDNYAPLLVGQLKHLAVQTYAYLSEYLDLSPSDWDAAYVGLSSNDQNPYPALIAATSGTPEDFKPATVGQLKFLAAGPYKLLSDYLDGEFLTDRFRELGLSSDQFHQSAPFYPWPESGAGSGRAIATLGQAKLVFSFDPYAEISGPQPAGTTSTSDTKSPTTGITNGDAVFYQQLSWVEPVATSFAERNWYQFFDPDESAGNDGWFRSPWFGYYYLFGEYANDNDYLNHSDASGGWLWTYHHQWTWYHDLQNVNNDLFAYDYPNLGWWYVSRDWSDYSLSSGVTTNPYQLGWIWSYELSPNLAGPGKHRYLLLLGWYDELNDNAVSGRWFAYDDADDLRRLRFVPDTTDSDSDGLADEWETNTRNFGSLSHVDGGADDDPDFDGLSNMFEQVMGSIPRNKDADYDLFSTEVEDIAGASDNTFTTASAAGSWPNVYSIDECELIIVTSNGSTHHIDICGDFDITRL